MYTFLLLYLIVGFNVHAQELCTEIPVIQGIGEWHQGIKEAMNWGFCERFSIKDKSALKDPKSIHPMVLRFYRQTELKLQDPISDFSNTRADLDIFGNALGGLVGTGLKRYDADELKEAKLCAQVLFNLPDDEELRYLSVNLYEGSEEQAEDLKLLKELLKGYSDEDHEKGLAKFEKGHLVVESGNSPVNPQELALDIITVIEEEEKKGLELIAGEKHRWSEQFKDERNVKERVKSVPSKLLATLSGGRSDSLMATGTEKELDQFILSSSNLSLTPAELFRKSFQLNKGNMYLSLLTIENVLSRSWQVTGRGKLVQTNKLKPFGKVFGSFGDVYGHWYHLFGMLSYGYSEGELRAKVVGKTEAIGSSILSGFKGEDQENRINMDGGRAGGLLHNYVKARQKGKDFVIRKKSKNSKDDIPEKVKKQIERILKK